MADRKIQMASEEAHALEQRLNLTRGRLLAQYAYIEYSLADIYVKFQKFECYSHFSARFPRSLNDRLKGIERLLTVEGPLTAYSEQLRENIRYIEGYTELRHFLAHGHGTLNVDEAELLYKMYQENDAGGWSINEYKTNVPELERVYDELNAYGTKMWHQFKAIYRETGVAEG